MCYIKFSFELSTLLCFVLYFGFVILQAFKIFTSLFSLHVAFLYFSSVVSMSYLIHVPL